MSVPGTHGPLFATLLPLLVVALLAPDRADALSLESIGNFTEPTYVTSHPDDANRLFVVERPGRIQLVENGSPSLFLNIEPLVLSPPETGAESNEGGVFSIAFAPWDQQVFYVTYRGADDPATPADETGQWHLDEFRADGDTVDPTSRREVLTIDYPAAQVDEQLHYGGQLHFGPDGFLYASTGDGGPQGDPNGNAQDEEDLLGSILRIDPRGSEPGDYVVPTDNPYVGSSAGADEIWSEGLRNPWRFSFDRLTGDLVIGDVGFNSWEEVDFVEGPEAGKGDNFGWNCYEGTHVFSTASPCDVAHSFTPPVFEYEHEPWPGNCSITGGYVVRDTALDDLYGRYLYADFCAGELRSLDFGPPGVDRSEELTVEVPTSFGEDASCRLYVTSWRGPVYRLTDPGSPGGGCPEAPAGSPSSGPPPLEPPPQPLEQEPPVPDGMPCAGKQATIDGDSGSEVLRGTVKPDVIAGGPGRDTIRGLGGDDLLCGGPGGDTLIGGRGADQLRGGPARDELLGGRGDDTCDGGGARDVAAGCAVERRV